MKQFFILSMIAAGMLLFASCGQKEDAVIEVSSITITPSTLTLTVGDQQTLTATVEPENAADKTVAWSSSDPSIAEVGASSGEVTAKAAGTATVTATAANGRTATCEVTVSEVVIEATSVTVSPNSLELKAGEKQTLTATVEPQDATDQTVTWSSSRPAIAEVNASTGEVTAKAPGTADITATTASGLTATCEIKVWEVVGELIQEGDILIVAYGGAPYEELKETRFDMCWTWTNDIPALTGALDQIHSNGMKLLVVLQKDRTEEVVNAIKGHPGLGGYILGDEPPIQLFDHVDTWVREIQALDAEHYCYLNLLPNYASPEQLGTSSYLDYLRAYAKLTTGFISFDFYPTNGRGNVHANWYVNMRDVRDVANEYDIPFWAYVSSTRGAASDPAFTLGELSLMVYVNLAYGAQAIQYFVFAGSSTAAYPYFHTPINNGARTPTYGYVKQLNTEVKRLSHIFSKSKVLGVWHTGSTLPPGTVRLQEENPPEMPPIKSLKTNEGGVLVSLIEKDNNRYLVIVNRNYLNPAQLTLTVNENMVRKVWKDGTITNMYSGTVEIDAGDVVIYMWGESK